MRRRVETIRRSPSRTSYAACRVAGSLRRKPPRATRRSTSRRGERRTERNTPAILARSDEETTSVAGRATPDKPPRADAPPRAAVGLGEWRAIRRRSPLQIYLRPAGGAAAPVGWRSIPPAVASRQWSLLSRGRLLHSHWALFDILQQDFVARFQGRVPRHRAAERSVLRPQRQRSRNRLPLWIVWSSKISCLEFCACDRMPHQKPGCDAFGSTLTLIQAGRPEVTARSKAGRSSLGSVIHSAWPPNTAMMRS